MGPRKVIAVGTGGLSRAAGGVSDNAVVDAGARAGYAVNGLLHLLIAWLALQVAFGRSGANADPSGAMAMVAGTPAGSVVLIAVVVAFALLAVWQFAESVRGRGADRIKAVAKALTYLALAWGAVSFLRGLGGSGSAQATDMTSALMGLPFGAILVGAVGAAVVGVGGYHINKGWAEKFRSDLASTPSRFVIIAGRVGYIAKGVALIAVGGGLISAAVQHRASQSQGLDGALHEMVTLPLGQALVAVVAVGFAAYGLYSFSRARRTKT
jgi:hypothetical protein